MTLKCDSGICMGVCGLGVGGHGELQAKKVLFLDLEPGDATLHCLGILSYPIHWSCRLMVEQNTLMLMVCQTKEYIFEVVCI